MLRLRKVIVAICVSPVLGRPLHDIRLSSQTQSPLANHVYPLTPHLFQTETHQLGSSSSSHSQAEADAYYSPKPKQHLDYPEFVVLHFGAHGGVPESTIAIPLRKRISPYDIHELPLYPRAVSILAASGRTSNPSHLGDPILDRIVCLMHPLVAADEHGRDFRRYRPIDASGEWSLWFRHRDGMVDLEDPDERWFIGGRPIESYECY